MCLAIPARVVEIVDVESRTAKVEIGEVEAEPPGIVAMRTGFGGTLIVDMLVGEQLPRIC